MNNTTTRIAEIFQKTFDFPADKVTPQTVPDDVPRWDSLGHISLVSAIQAEFGVELELDEIMEMVSVAKIEEVINTKTK